MRVIEVMSGDVEFVAPGASVQEAAILMGEIDVGALPVGSAERPIGVITSRDLLYRICAAGLDPAQTRVKEVMSESVLCCHEGDELSAAMDLMAAHHVRRLLVRNADERTVGWITLSDISRRLLIDSPIIRHGLDEISRASEARAGQDPPSRD
ncbi:MAG: hypothetical protein JWM38_777 [Sphingomonas bacterium]|jgi:CBS domain-containing protein|nr:hypothetical protein [Sphingomonas bacterium]MDB5717350.1 hypothetical protein [Sphingomonas bacterium]